MNQKFITVCEIEFSLSLIGGREAERERERENGKKRKRAHERPINFI